MTMSGCGGITSNDVVGATRWPDASTGESSSGQQETVLVNALGQLLVQTDRNGNSHTLAYDILGRMVSDTVTTLGSRVDGSALQVETAYDGHHNSTFEHLSFVSHLGFKLRNELGQSRSVEPTDRSELHEVDPPVTELHFRDERLGQLETFGHLNLVACFQEPKSSLQRRISLHARRTSHKGRHALLAGEAGHHPLSASGSADE